MSNNEEWNKIKEYSENRAIEIKNKYKVDIDKKPWEKLEKFKKNIKNVKIIFVLLMCVIIIISIQNIIGFANGSRLLWAVTGEAGKEIEMTKDKTYMFGRGFYICRFKDIPDLEFHVLYFTKEEFKSDCKDRYYKYFFEKWEDTEKYKFVISESYEDCSYRFTKKSNWLLHYETYIEANSYEEVMEATEVIIRFFNYAEIPYIIPNSYIKVGETMILPRYISNQSDDSIRKTAEQEYLKIIENIKK